MVFQTEKKNQIAKQENKEVMKEEADTVTIYVLRLKESKYYVGKTTDIEKRYEQHVNGKASYYTKHYKPISIHEQFEGDDYDEDKTVIRYMDCLLYTSPSPRDMSASRMPSSA